MTDAEILVPLKIDLQISGTGLDDYLTELITSAKSFIQTEGIIYDDTNESDGILVEMYSAYLYRSRKGETEMPRSLRWALNNRLFQQKAGC